MKVIRYIYLVLNALIFIGPMQSPAQDAKSILEKMDNIIFSPKDKQGKITIILSDKGGNEKIREASMFQKGPDKRLYRYTKPESQAGIATLSLPDGVMWLYMPAFEKPKRISILAKSQAFTGTDFSYEDMANTPYSERFDPEFLQTEKNAYVIQLTPKTGKSQYSKIIARVNIENGYPISMHFHNETGKLIKFSTYKYEKIGKYWNAAEVEMKDLEKEHSTKIILSDMKFDQGLSDDLFLVENMKK